MSYHRIIIASMALFVLLAATVMAATPTIAVQDTDLSIKEVSILLPYSASKSQLETLYESSACGGDQSGSIMPAQPSSMWGEQTQCSTAVKVSVRSGFASRESTLIIAEDKATGRRLRCEVFVDRIASISIISTTRTMYKDAAEILEVQAFDFEGNRFSTILGAEFEWSVSSGNIVQIVPFKDFSRETEPVLIAMEQEGMQGSMVLVQGIDTGRATITARLTEAAYAETQPSAVTISVLEPLQLNPAHLLYVIPGTQIRYLLQTEKRNQVERIPMPNPQYVWSTSNKKVGEVDNSGLFLALAHGKTDLNVQHKNMSENRAHTIIHVVEPAHLALKIDGLGLGPGPVVNYQLIEHNNYTITVELYDPSGHKIYNPEIAYDVDISRDYFSPIPSPSNKGSDTYFVRTLKEGITTVKASLLRVLDPKTGKYTSLLNPISVEQDLTISPQIKVDPSTLFLPYLPGQTQTAPVKATGGSGEFNWYSANKAIVDVDSHGNVSTISKPGVGEVTVTDKKNPHNRAVAKANVITPSSLGFAPAPSETEMGTPLLLSTLLSSDALPGAAAAFAACAIENLSWSLDDTKHFTLSPDVVPAAEPNHCSTKRFNAVREGPATVVAEHAGMRASTKIFSYPRLTLDRDNILVALGSAVDVHYTGGPAPWHLDPSSHFQEVTVSGDKSAVRVDMLPNTNAFRLTCLGHTEQDVKLTVGNKPTGSNPFPAQPSASLKFRCRPPASLSLEAVDSPADRELALRHGAECTDTVLALSSDRKKHGHTLKTRNNRELPFTVNVLDESGAKFTNHSSLKFAWKSSDSILAAWAAAAAAATLKLGTGEGRVQVSSAVAGYDPEVLRKAQVPHVPTLDSSRLTSSLDLDLLSNVRLEPARSTLYLDERNTLDITAYGGGTNFVYNGNNTKVASLESRGSSVRVTPLQPGYLSIDVSDVCLGGANAAPAVVHVSEVSRIEAALADHIEVGGTTGLETTALDSTGKPFDLSQHKFIDFVPHVDNPNVLTVTPSADDPRRFTLRGLAAGLATIAIATTNPRTGHTTTTRVPVQVYPPFRLSPQVLHLLPGGTFQMAWSGGAPSQVVSFNSADSSIVAINDPAINLGELTAGKIGETSVIATAELVNDKGVRSIIGSDKVSVIVKNMTGIRLHTSINTLLVGEEAKVRVIGANGETPFTYGTVDLYFRWESVDSSVLQLAPVYERANTTVDSEGGFSVRALARSVGATQLTAWASHGGDRANHVFQTPALPITVLPDVAIPTHSLLLPINSQALVSSLKGLDYHSLDCSPSASCADILSLTDNKLATFERIGTCFLSVRRNGRADTSALVKVSVKPFSHLELIPINPLSTQLAVGASLKIGVYLRDDIGQLFTDYGTATVFDTDLSTSGVISVSQDGAGSPPSVITVKGMRAGTVTLRVRVHGMDHIDDYIKIVVGRIVEPENAVVHIGATLIYQLSQQQLDSASYTAPKKGDKVWISSDSDIVTIDSHSGRAEALAPGRTTLKHVPSPTSTTQVQVERIADIGVDLSNAPIISMSTQKYRYPLTFYAADHVEFSPSSASIQNHVNCQCHIQETKFASATCESGPTQYTCVVKPLRVPTSDKITMIVHVSDKKNSYKYTKSFSLPFESTFVIHGDQKRFSITPANHTVTFDDMPIFISSAEGKSKQSISVTYTRNPVPEHYAATTVFSDLSGYFATALALAVIGLTFGFLLKHNQKPRSIIHPQTPPRVVSQSPFRSPPPHFASPTQSDSLYLSQRRF
eukprot:gene2661-3071_t